MAGYDLELIDGNMQEFNVTFHGPHGSGLTILLQNAITAQLYTRGVYGRYTLRSQTITHLHHHRSDS